MLTTLGAIAVSVLMQPYALQPNCKPPPPDSSDMCVTCYEDACMEYLDDWYACETIGCRRLAGYEYSAKLDRCPCSNEAVLILGSLNDSQKFDALTILLTWR